MSLISLVCVGRGGGDLKLFVNNKRVKWNSYKHNGELVFFGSNLDTFLSLSRLICNISQNSLANDLTHALF